jgi:hypothetical protein
MSVVIDTNVLVVANRKHPPASLGCIEACMQALEDARNGVTLIDDLQLILDEYRQHCSFAGQPGLGDAFFKWLWSNQANARHCLRVSITPHPQRGFAEFPDDEALAGFDSSDRKFVAVALGSQQDARVLNASDTDWWQHREALQRHGVQIAFLCPELMRD